MVLDIAQFLVQNISKEMKISHFNCKLFCGKASKIKADAKQQIIKEFGESYLEDAQYLIIMSGDQVKEVDAKKKLFGILDRSLGEISNNMSESDIKDIKDDDGLKFRFLKITVK